MITIELTPQEATLIHAALKCWENEPCKDTIVSTMLAAMLGAHKGSSEEKWEAEIHARFDKSAVEVRKREMQALMLRAKLAQAEARASEHVDVAKGEPL